MKSDIPIHRPLNHLTLLVIFAPLYVTVLCLPGIGLLPDLSSNWSAGTLWARPELYAMLLLCLVSLLWLVWRGRLVGPSLILLVVLLVNPILSNTIPGEKIYSLSIGAGDPILGIDVYCNDIYLGQTPLTITEAQFNQKVAPRDTPPDQPLMLLGDSDDDFSYSAGKYYYVPNDIFEVTKQWPPDHRRYSVHKTQEILREFQRSKYWWHFEKEGCVGLSTFSNFSSGSSGFNHRVTIGVNPNITFLSTENHLDALLAQLQADNHKPSLTWIDHFLHYKDVLFKGLYDKTLSDESLQPVLHTIVQAEFDLPARLSEADCQRVIELIAERAAQSHCFTVPSLESLGIEEVARACPQALVERFITWSNLSLGGSEGTRGWVDGVTYRRSGPRAKLLPLEYAIERTTPPELFDRLVYMSRKGGDLELLCNYPRQEIIDIVRHYFHGIEQQGGIQRDIRQRKAMRLCSRIQNPLLEEILRNFVREHSGSGIGARHAVEDFIEARINHPQIDQGELAGWVYHWAPLADRRKLNYFLEIRDPNVCHYVRMILSRNQNLREDVLYQLSQQPNPALGQYLVETYDWWEGPQGPDSLDSSFTGALVKTNVPEVRQLIEQKWHESEESRARILAHLGVGHWRQPHLNWLVPLIGELTLRRERLAAIRLLSRVDTPEAYQLAEQWAADPDSDIVSAARDQLDIHAQRQIQQQTKIDRAADLLAGKIQPDDMIKTGAAYQWDGNEYTLASVSIP